ncbi:alanyl-tRNA synthetase [Deinococcus metalli]|uniref:Alanyl-tRNA synthetase n=1 Tax=Deinococcus metalli TaxID=1141878 RepID=A0A7W8NQS1_9DEIO|nr:DHHA1 domain-containing protein [Deinococcus metalli]MBB5375382.1 alanyl-tRNA synthetase [Deinococcus metalli]GHF29711.1 serine-tRNA(Ala) deacylase [Deinococcus metalli]
MTRALYHDLPPRLDFTATVTAVDGPRLQLDATAFYPEGGGQPGDVGDLAWPGGSAHVTTTRKVKATGEIWHELDGDMPTLGAAVSGTVDAGSRWRHTQRHSGEHLLAQAFARVNPAFAVEAVSMTSPECTLDLRGDPGEEDVYAAEALLRKTLGRGDLILATPVVAEDDLGRYPLRRTAKVRGQVRLVIFQDAAGTPFDVSACGGTHVPRAAMAAPVVVLRTERIKGGLTRVVFMAGEEASAYLSGVYRSARALAQSFSVPVARVTERVDALRAERDALHAELDTLRHAHARTLVAGTAAQVVGTAVLRAVAVDDPALLLPVLSAAGVGDVVAAVTPAGRCGVGSGRADVDAGALLRQVLAHTGGKGGGKPALAQGQTEQPADFLAAVATALAER